MAEALLILGSNLGDRKENLRKAIQLMEEKTGHTCRASSIYETAPWGKHSEHFYYNQAISIQTHLKPIELLTVVQDIEKQLGRVREERWGDRTLDIDIVFYGTLVVDNEVLTIPHPELANRKFVLVPLAEIAPHQKHPLLGKMVVELLEQTPDEGEVKKLLVL